MADAVIQLTDQTIDVILGGPPGPRGEKGNPGAAAAFAFDFRADAIAAAWSAGDVFYLAEEGREGWFMVKTGAPPADPEQGIYLDLTGPLYAEREWNGVVGRPEWFGATPRIATADCRPAIAACEALCPIIEYAAVDYYAPGTFTLAHPTRLHRGVRGEGSVSGGGTRLVMRAASATVPVAHIGPAADPGTKAGYAGRLDGDGIAFVRDTSLSGAPPVPGSGKVVDFAAGIEFRWLTDSQWDHVTSIDSPVGLSIRGCIDVRWPDWRAYRGYASQGSDDVYVGADAGGDLPALASVIGANASIYLIGGRVGAAPSLSVAYSAGVRLWGYCADSFVDRLETVVVARGVDIDGRKSDGSDILLATDAGQGGFAHQDIGIKGVVSDLVPVAAVYVAHTNVGGLITIDDTYGAPAYAGGCVVLDASHAQLTITNTKAPCANTADGFRAVSSSGFTLTGLMVRDADRPLIMVDCSDFHIEAQVYRTAADTGPAADIENGSRGILIIGVNGVPNAFDSGVSLDAACDNMEVNASRVNIGAFTAVSAAYKVLFDGTDASAGAGAGAFTTAGNVLSGVKG